MMPASPRSPAMIVASAIRAIAVAAAPALVGVSFAPRAAEPPLIVKKSTAAGREVLIRGFAEFDGGCNLKHVQTIAVAAPPGHGSVESRPGTVTIGPNWVGGGHCEGTTLQGVRVYYVPAPGFSGTDRFSIDVGYALGRTVRADV